MKIYIDIAKEKGNAYVNYYIEEENIVIKTPFENDKLYNKKELKLERFNLSNSIFFGDI